jgi:hypothetical protein
MLCWMCDFMVSIWSLREEKNEFQLFLILRVHARSAVKRLQGVCWQEFEFYLRNLRRDTNFLISCRSVGEAQSRARCARASWNLKSYQLRWRWKDCYCKECTESRTQITIGYLKDCRKECEQDLSRKLKFTSESSRGLVPLKSSKEDGERNHRAEVKFSGRTPSQFGQRFLKSELDGQNSPWRTHEVARIVGSSEAARWLGVGRIHHPDIKNQSGPLIMVCLSRQIISGIRDP